MSIKPSRNWRDRIIEELVAIGFNIELVLADSLYGESHRFVGLLDRLKLPWIVAIRSNHAVWMPNDAEIEYSDWQRFERVFSKGKSEERYIQETIFGRRLQWRYWTLTNDPVTLPDNSIWHAMSYLEASNRGKSIDEENFAHRHWRPVLTELGIVYRKPYCTRSTFCNHMLTAGVSPTVVAAIAGHSIKVLYSNYANLIDKPSVPELY